MVLSTTPSKNRHDPPLKCTFWSPCSLICTILIFVWGERLYMILMYIYVRRRAQCLIFLTHLDSLQNIARLWKYLELNMPIFWKIVSLNGNFYHPYILTRRHESMIWMCVYVCWKVHYLTFLTHLDSHKQLSRFWKYHELNMPTFRID